MGISRGPLREALQRLVAEGLVVVVAHRGAFVRDFSPLELQQMYEFREIIESAAARLAASRASDQGIAELRAMLRDTAQLLDKTAAGIYPASPDFHRRILELSGNPSLLRAGTELQTQVKIARRSSGRLPGRARAALDEHVVIVDAIERRDQVAAQQSMVRHLANSYDSFSHAPRNHE
jgi:DNA-binding GntR family transcriptional regulator